MSGSLTRLGDKTSDAVVDGSRNLARAFLMGWRKVPYRSSLLYANFAAFEVLLYVAFLRGWPVRSLGWALSRVFPDFFVRFVLAPAGWVPLWIAWLIGSVILVVLVIAAVGAREFVRWFRFQRAIDCLCFKNGHGRSPGVMGIYPDGAHRTRLTVLSEGIGLDKYEVRRGDLETAFGAAIEGLKSSSNLKFIEITLAKRRLPNLCKFEELIEQVKAPNSFIIGETIGGTLTQCIRDLPHMLIAGTTGGGKSVFFKQALLSLLKSSPRIQMYLLDLKGGVEMKEFSALPNVEVAKNEAEAVRLLTKVAAEMDRRFQFMESKGYKKIDSERDELDLIVVGVDEASVLYTKSNSKDEFKVLIDEARRLTDRIAKLARAAGIHLILATQKVSKETIDTKIQENIGGRACFRMNTLPGSMQVLGNKMAFELTDNPGRAIWSSGNTFVEFQAPYLSDIELMEVCNELDAEFESGTRKNFQPMLTAMKAAPNRVPLSVAAAPK